MSESKSCLVAKLKNYIDVDENLENLLANLEKTEKNYGENTAVYHDGDTAKNLYVVKSGCFIGYTLLPDGGRMVTKIFHPGDIIGFDGIAFDYQAQDLKSCTEGCLCPFEKKELDVVFSIAPKLTALLFTLAVRDQIILVDRFRAATRMNAQDRITHFLLEIAHKLRMTNPDMTNEFLLPLTQSEIGDAIGLTNVSVSRAFKKMEEQGQIERRKDKVILLEEKQMIQSISFEDRFSTIDTSWFPMSA